MNLRASRPNQATESKVSQAPEQGGVRPPSPAAEQGSLERPAADSSSMSRGAQQALAVRPPSLELLAAFSTTSKEGFSPSRNHRALTSVMQEVIAKALLENPRTIAQFPAHLRAKLHAENGYKMENLSNFSVQEGYSLHESGLIQFPAAAGLSSVNQMLEGTGFSAVEVQGGYEVIDPSGEPCFNSFSRSLDEIDCYAQGLLDSRRL